MWLLAAGLGCSVLLGWSIESLWLVLSWSAGNLVTAKVITGLWLVLAAVGLSPGISESGGSH